MLYKHILKLARFEILQSDFEIILDKSKANVNICVFNNFDLYLFRKYLIMRSALQPYNLVRGHDASVMELIYDVRYRGVPEIDIY